MKVPDTLWFPVTQMLPAPFLNLLHILVAMKVARVFPAPLPLTRPLAGDLAFRFQAKPLVGSISRIRSEPNLTVTTLTESFCAHRFLPSENRGEYNKRPRIERPFTSNSERIGLHHFTAKKEEDDPFGSGWEGRKRIFQIG